MMTQTCRECAEDRPLVNEDGLCPLCQETAPPRLTVEEELATCLEDAVQFLSHMHRGEVWRVICPRDFTRWNDALERYREVGASSEFEGFSISNDRNAERFEETS